jgi:formylglycine-generating enzyme required for sulfatase activity
MKTRIPPLIARRVWRAGLPGLRTGALTLALLIGLSAPAVRATVTVSNVTAAQTPGTKLVVITYDVASTAASSVTISLAIRDGETPIPATSLSGHIGAGVATGTGRSITWNAGADWNGNFSANLKAYVTAVDGSSPPEAGNYMVVDLSGGPTATNYPVTYLDAVPPGGWTDAHKTTLLVLRRIPAGTFTMGSPADELGRWNDETQHQVTLTKDFYIGVFQVTQKQWERVMGTTPSFFAGDKRPVEQVSYNDIRGSSAGAGWPANNNVDASSFMGRLRARTGIASFDLPTEAQWEYACRAGTTRAYNDQTKNGGAGSDCLTTGWGSDANLEPLAWYGANSSSARHREVGTKQANAWGLYDMHGNVREWCLDWYGTYPGTVSDPVGAGNGSFRVLRGGSWISFARFCRSAFRDSGNPSDRFTDGGLRVCSASPVQ